MTTTVQQNLNSPTSKPYITEQVNTMTPMELLLKLYDVAIASCAQRDKERLSRALVELIAALNFDYQEIAVTLFRLYNYCLRNARVGHFDLVKPVLTELRDAWTRVQAAEDTVAETA